MSNPGFQRGEFVGTYSQLAVVLDGILVILLDVIREIVDWDVVVVNIFHDLRGVVSLKQSTQRQSRTLFLKALSSLGVKESALPITGMTFTRGDKRRINSMSISLKLRTRASALYASHGGQKRTNDQLGG